MLLLETRCTICIAIASTHYCNGSHSECRLPTTAGRFILLFSTTHLLIAFSDGSEARNTLDGHRDEDVGITLTVVCADLALFLLNTLGNFTPHVLGAFFDIASGPALDVAAETDLDVHIEEALDVDTEVSPSALFGDELKDVRLFSSSLLSDRAVWAVPSESNRPLMINFVFCCSGEYSSSTELSNRSRLKASGLRWKLCNELRDGIKFCLRRSAGGLGTKEESIPLGG